MHFAWEKYKNFIVDMDGVIYRGNQPLPGSADFFRFLRNRHSRIAFFSNNSTITKKQYVEKLHNMDIIAREDEIISSSSITAYYIGKEKPQATVYCIGEEGIRDELRKNGAQIIADPASHQVNYVVVGLDRKFDYDKLTKAMWSLLKGAKFYGTNPDLTYPLEDSLIPGCGALLASIEACTGVKPRVFGKPCPESIHFLLEMTGFHEKETIFIGDRLDTDIELAKRQGIFSILVLTGVHQGEDVKRTGITPDVIVENLVELKKLMLMRVES